MLELGTNGRGASGAQGPRTAVDLLDALAQLVREGQMSGMAPLPTGFQPLDRYLDGGLHLGELALVGGVQGVGKTTLTLQMARNLATRPDVACGYFCYEHDEASLLQRLISLESLIGAGRPSTDAAPLTHLRESLLGTRRAVGSVRGLADALAGHPSAVAALERIARFGDRLYLQKASAAATDVPTIRECVRQWKERHGPRVVVFVDYLQKIPVAPEVADEAERVTRVANSLKDLALDENVAVVAVVAADIEGLKAQRLRIHHLRGSSSLMYEADLALILNNKYRIVAKRNVTFNLHKAQDFRNWVVLSLEKNRSGRDAIDLELRAMFAYAAFDPNGTTVAEQLVDERIDEE